MTGADTPPVRVALADDQPLVRAGFHALLAHAPGIHVVGEAVDGHDAVALAHHARPDVLLMDVRMPGLDGIEATRRIGADPALSGVHVVVLTTYALDEYVFSALAAGAAGFLLKDVEPDELRAAVRVVARGDALLAPAVTRTVIRSFTAGPRRSPGAVALLAGLTERERELTRLAAEGLDNPAIAARLSISPATVKTHLTRAMTKVHARDRAQLVVLAYQSGLVSTPP